MAVRLDDSSTAGVIVGSTVGSTVDEEVAITNGVIISIGVGVGISSFSVVGAVGSVDTSFVGAFEVVVSSAGAFLFFDLVDFLFCLFLAGVIVTAEASSVVGSVSSEIVGGPAQSLASAPASMTCWAS